MAEFKGKTILITGGTGSFGGYFANYLLNKDFKEIRIFSRDELKQEQMRQRLNHSKIKFYIGDIRDRGSVDDALTGIDYVFYSVAMKQVPSCEKEFRTEVMKIAGARYTLVRTLILSGGVGTMGQNSSTRNRA